MSPVQRAGADRGLGRYAAEVASALTESGVDARHLTTRSATWAPARVQEYVELGLRSAALRRERFDVFHATNPFVTAVGHGGRHVTTILDVIPLEMASHRKTGIKAKFFFRIASRADVILTISQFSANRIVRTLHVDPSRVHVATIPPAAGFCPEVGPRDEETLSRLGLTAPFLATLVDTRTPDPRKRASWLPALAQVGRDRGLDTVAVGGGTREAFAGTVVRGVGRLSDADLAAVLRAAYVFVYTSAYEGQGLPPLEAIACGTPVIGVANTAIPEMVGRAGILVEDDPDAWNRPDQADSPALARLQGELDDVLSDRLLRDALVDETRKQAAIHSREAFRVGLLTAYGHA
jgi:glycosyltransferase involved in cell wall biosynthesis